MVTTEEGNNRKCPPASCRDKGRGGVDEGALCLSWLGCDLGALRNPQGIALPPGQAQGPHPAPHPPLVPTGPLSVVTIHRDRGRHITGFGRQHLLSAVAAINRALREVGCLPTISSDSHSLASH